MVRIDIQYDGDLRCRVTHAPSGTQLVTDAPSDNQGRGESFSPTDLLATALGTCMLTVMGIRAREHGWDIAGARARVEKRMVADPLRRVGGLELVIQVPGELGAEARRVLEDAARACPVAVTLESAPETPLRFEWDSALIESD